jgi:hypothetical protein
MFFHCFGSCNPTSANNVHHSLQITLGFPVYRPSKVGFKQMLADGFILSVYREASPSCRDRSAKYSAKHGCDPERDTLGQSTCVQQARL